jgi:hypothetical protein
MPAISELSIPATPNASAWSATSTTEQTRNALPAATNAKAVQTQPPAYPATQHGKEIPLQLNAPA